MSTSRIILRRNSVEFQSRPKAGRAKVWDKDSTGEVGEIEDLKEAEKAQYTLASSVCLIVGVFFNLDHHDRLNGLANG
jgi:hypothetical protein